MSRYFFLPLRYDTSLLPAAKTFRVNDSVRSCTCYPPVSQIFVVMNNVEVQLKPEWIHSSTGFEPLPPRLNKRYYQRTVQRSHMLATWLVLKGSSGQRGQAAHNPDLIFDLHTWFKLHFILLVMLMFEQGLLPLLEEAWRLKSRRSLNFFRFLFNSGFRSHLILNIIIGKTKFGQEKDLIERIAMRDCSLEMRFALLLYSNQIRKVEICKLL